MSQSNGKLRKTPEVQPLDAGHLRTFMMVHAIPYNAPVVILMPDGTTLPIRECHYHDKVVTIIPKEPQ